MLRTLKTLGFALLIGMAMLNVVTPYVGAWTCTAGSPCTLDCVCHAIEATLSASACTAGDITVTFSTCWPLGGGVWTGEPNTLTALRLYRIDCSDWSSSLIYTWSGASLTLGCGCDNYQRIDSPGNGSWAYAVKVETHIGGNPVVHCTVYYKDLEGSPICTTCS